MRCHCSPAQASRLLTLGEGAGAPLDPAGVAFAAGRLAPYTFELIVLRRLSTVLLGVIMSLEPAIAALLGFVILSQGLAVSGVIAIAMVIVASARARSRLTLGE